MCDTGNARKKIKFRRRESLPPASNGDLCATRKKSEMRESLPPAGDPFKGADDDGAVGVGGQCPYPPERPVKRARWLTVEM